MSRATTICSGCFAAGAPGTSCAECGAALPERAAAAVDTWIAWLSLVARLIPPWSVFGRLCDGPRLVASDRTSAAWVEIWRHRTRTIGVWSASPEVLPPLGSTSIPPEAVPAVRAWSRCGLVLIEPPHPGARYRACAARTRPHGERLPPLSHLLDRLDVAWRLVGSAPAATALVDGPGVSDEDRAWLGERAPLAVCPDRESACRWILDRVDSIARPTTPPPPAAPGRGAAAPSPGAANRGRQGRPTAATRSSGTDRIAVLDAGGASGAHLVARLHETSAHLHDVARSWHSRVSEALGLRLGACRWVRPVPDAASLSYGRMQRLRQQAPPPGERLPTWSGVVRGWHGSRRLTVEHGRPGLSAEPAALVLGVGPSRLTGESQWVDILDLLSAGAVVPAAIVRDPRADSTLLRWVRYECPRVPEFPDTREGGLEAMGAACRVARAWRSA